MEVAVSIGLGLGLSATCGLRVFVPLLCASITAHLGWIDLGPGFEWMASWPAMLAFAAAMVFELTGYAVPWIDNLLDSIATPMAVAAGVLLMASVVGGMPPLLRWSVAVIAGGGAAGTVQSGTVLLRGASSVTTGGLGNPVFSAVEAAASLVGSVVSIMLPLLAGLLALLLLLLVAMSLHRRRRAVPRTDRVSIEGRKRA